MNEEEAMKVVDKILDYIEQNIMQSITLQELSALTGYSPWYVARIFKEVTKKSPYEYIRFRRLSEAALMLRDNKKKVIDIALDMVYENQEGFTRAFTKEFGISPGRYRVNNQQRSMNFLPSDTIVPDGYEFIDIPATKLGVCWICGLEEEVYCKEDQCADQLRQNEMIPSIGSDGAWWRFERYNCPRFTQKDDNGKIILDMCHFLNRT